MSLLPVSSLLLRGLFSYAASPGSGIKNHLLLRYYARAQAYYVYV